MQLTNFTDFSLRVLLYAASQGDRRITIEETAGVYKISRAHLMKVVNQLATSGFLTSVRGRAGGVVLAMPPEKIRLGDVIRATEPDFALVECFGNENHCAITPRCKLRGVLHEARAGFLATLDRYTLADIALKPKDFLSKL